MEKKYTNLNVILDEIQYNINGDECSRSADACTTMYHDGTGFMEEVHQADILPK